MNKKVAKPRGIFSVPSAARTRTSDVILSLVERLNDEHITLNVLTERMGDRTFGMLLIIVAIFSAVPLISSIAGLLVFIIGIQMCFGRTHAWLPKQLLNRKLESKNVKLALTLFEPKVRYIERYLRPRLKFTEAYIFDRMNGLIVAVLGIVIMIPIPFTNILPALVVIIMGLGLIERDGLVQLCAALLGISLLILGFSFISA